MISVETLERLYQEAGLIAICNKGRFVGFDEKLDN